MGEIVIHQPPGLTISYFPSLTPLAGSIKAAILLQQITYLTKRGHNHDRWITKDGGQQEWIQDTGLTLKEFNLALSALVARRLIERDYDRRNHQLCVRLRIDNYNKAVDDLQADEETQKHLPKRHMPKRHMPVESLDISDTSNATLIPDAEHMTKGHMPKGQMASSLLEDEHMTKGHFVCNKEYRVSGETRVLQEKEQENEKTSSSLVLPSPEPETQDTTPRRRVPRSQQPGELHPHTIEAVQGMMVERFHCLAEPTKDNEIFWDAQIAYILEANALSFIACLKKVDAYWSSNPDKVAMKAPGLRKQMRRGIEIEVEKAQRAMKGTPRRYG